MTRRRAPSEQAFAVAEACGSDLTVQGRDGRIEKQKRGRATKEGATYIGIGTVALILIIVLLIWLL